MQGKTTARSQMNFQRLCGTYAYFFALVIACSTMSIHSILEENSLVTS